jgi:hypothetical protein
MKTNFFKLSILALFISFASCSNDDDAIPTTAPAALETKTFSNLYAPQSGGQGQPTAGEFTKFSFAENAVVTNDNWDIAFRGTTLIVNGGTEIGLTDEPTRTGIAAVSTLSSIFENVTTIPAAATFVQDGVGTYAFAEPWYDYNPTTHIILPVAGKVYVVKTYNGKYAKFEILSYYENAPANPNLTSPSRYFTFKYVYQPASETNF